MDSEDFFAAAHVGKVDCDLAVETAGAEECGVEDVGAVGCGDDDDAVLRVEAVHFDEESIERLLAFVMPSSHAVTTVAPHRIDFVDKNEAGGTFAALFEHVTDARGADPDEHFDEVRPADAEERNIGLAGDSAGEEGFASPGGSDHENPFGDAAAEFLEFFRVTEEVDQFGDFFPRLFNPGDILEGDLVFVPRHHAGFAFAEVEGTAAGHFKLRAENEIKNDEKEEDGEKSDERGGEEIGFRADGRSDAGFGHLLFQGFAVEGHENGGAEGNEAFLGFGGRRNGDHLAVVARNGLGVAAFFDHELDRLFLGGDDFSLGQEGGEFRVGKLVDLGEVPPTENEGAADEGESDGEEKEASPVELGVGVNAAGALIFWFVGIV